MANLKELIALRTKEELINYFKVKGKNITEKEIENLKRSYEQTELKDGALTMQQLDDVAGGLSLEFHNYNFEDYERRRKQTKTKSTSSFYFCVVKDTVNFPNRMAIAYFDHKDEISFTDYTVKPYVTASGLTADKFFEKYSHLGHLAIEAVNRSIFEINNSRLDGCETDLKFFSSITETPYKDRGRPSSPQDGTSTVQLSMPTYLLPKILNLVANIEREHPGSTSFSSSSEPPVNKPSHTDLSIEGKHTGTGESQVKKTICKGRGFNAAYRDPNTALPPNTGGNHSERTIFKGRGIFHSLTADRNNRSSHAVSRHMTANGSSRVVVLDRAANISHRPHRIVLPPSTANGSSRVVVLDGQGKVFGAGKSYPRHHHRH